MSIGYACIALGVPDSGMRGCLLKNATRERLDQLIAINLQTLSKVLNYNDEKRIHLFRISSDIIPLGSHPLNRNRWWEDHADTLQQLGCQIKKSVQRVSMHPGQYTVLNAQDPKIVQRAIEDLEYHARFLDALGLDQQHKIILHLGGVYGDASASLARFRTHFMLLSPAVQKRLVLENDERYPIGQVLELAASLQLPAVFDVFHHQCHPGPETLSVNDWIAQCRPTWKGKDGAQKIHYSQQEPGLRPGAHSHTLEIQPFLDFYQSLPDHSLDIMLEVKDKDLSVLKCLSALNCLAPDGPIPRE